MNRLFPNFFSVALILALVASLLSLASPALADNTAQTLPFSQNWSNTGLITTNDDWSGVAGIIGYRGDGLVASTNVDPQTVLADGSATPVDVNANQANPNTFTTGGVTEFEITDPVVALQGSGTADAPHIVIYLNTTGQSDINISYNVRDIDGAADNAVQQVALQYRVGNSGSFTNVPAGYIADATTGPSLATLVTPVNVTLPSAVDNQSEVQIRIITTDAVGSDEWIGIDDISITAAGGTTDPSGVGSANPSTVAPGGPSLLTVTVTPGTNPTSTGLAVSCDLSSIGGSATQTFFDDGTNGDVTIGDNIFSFEATVDSGTSEGAKNLPCAITDAETRTGNASIALTVQEPVAIVINEILADPDAVNGDANGDGVVETTNDEFVEIVNNEPSSLNISGWTLSDGFGVRHTFPANTVIPASCPIVVFAAGTPTGTFGYSVVQTASTGQLGLNNTGDTVTLNNGTSNVAAYTFGAEGGDNQSLTRDPDVTGADPLVKHSLATGSGGSLFSPGTKFDGSQFAGCPTERKIHEVQGNGAASPLVGQTVVVEGIVVGDFQDGLSGTHGDLNGFHLQEEDADTDADALTSEGVFVFDGSAPAVNVQVGDRVQVLGVVSEFNGMTEITSFTGVAVVSTGNPLPSAASLSLPVLSEDAFEAYEGMRVTFPQALYISEYFNFDRFGEIVLTSERHLTPTAEFDPGPDTIQAAQDFRLDRITLDDGRSNQNPDPAIHPDGNDFDLSNLFRGGDTVQNLTGVLDYAFGLYRIQPTQGGNHINANPRTATPDDVGGDVKVASFNVLNYFSTLDNSGPICGPLANQDCRGADDAAEFTRQRDKIFAALSAIDADIVGLIEIENHATDAALQDLVNGLNAEYGSSTYAYINTGPIGSDAIKVAIIYKPASVTPVGTTAVLDSVAFVNGGDAGPRNRPSLAQAFEVNVTGEVFVADVNHFKSKGSACDGENASSPPATGEGLCNPVRVNAATELLAWLATDPTGTGDPDVLIIGDLNAYDKEAPIDTLVASGYTDMVFQFQGEDAYSYVFDGQLGYLDHALASASLVSQVTGVTAWHINSDEPDLIDYDTTFKGPNQDAIYAPDAYRSSDHDPVIVGLELVPPTYTLQLLHYYGESGLLGVETGPIMGAMIDKFDDEYSNTLVLGEGDSFIPGPWLIGGADPSLNSVPGIGSTALGRPDIAIMNAFGTDASALGNHEFDLGSPVLQGAIQNSGAWVGAQFPLITTNLNFSADSALRGLADVTLGGTPATNTFAGQEASAIKGKIAPYAVVTTPGGEKIGLVGATTFELLSKTSPNGTVPKDDANPATDDLQEVAIYLQAAVDALNAMGVDKIVMVDQLDTIERNKLLAPMISGIDVMIAGGGHERMGDATDTPVGFNGHSADFIADSYPIVTTGLDGKTVLIVTTDTEYTYLGRLVLSFDANGEIILSSLDPVINGAYASTEANLQAAYGTSQSANDIIASSTIGSKVKAITTAINNVITVKDGTIWGYTNVYIEGDRAFGRTQEVNLGDISADANLYAVEQALGSGFITSLKNGGGLRASIGSIAEDGTKIPPIANPLVGKPAGAISTLDIENALRFDNRLMVFDTTPQGLKNILEFAAGLSPNPTVQSGGFMQIGGMRVSYDPGSPAGSKVKSIALTDRAGNFLAGVYQNGAFTTDAPATITMVSLNFTANGGDGYPIKVNADNFRFLLNDGTLSGPVDESLNFTAAGVVPANALGEQKAFQDYLQEFHDTPANAYNQADTPIELDQRIQILSIKPVDTVFPPDVMIDQAAGQADPTGTSPINFTVVFSRPVTGFDGSDVGLSGTANPTTAVVTEIAPNDGTTYNVAVSGMTANGAVTASVPANVVDGGNRASTSTDNTVTYDNTAPTIVVAAGGICGISSGTMNLTLADAEGDPLTLGGSSSNTSAVPNANIVFGGVGINRTVTITGVPAATVRTADITVTVSDGVNTSFITIRVVVGTSGNDLLIGSAGEDLLLGFNGQNAFFALDGNDVLCSGTGNDTMFAGDGDDTLMSGNGNDILFGGSGEDTIDAGDGRDLVDGGLDSDTLLGGDNNDIVIGGLGDDSLNGGNGNDICHGGPGTDTSSACEIKIQIP